MRLQIETTIKQEIEHIFGRRVLSSRDCNQLSAAIYHKTQHQLNPNTLRRFFGLVKAEYPASKTTLDILSRYCGYQSAGDVNHLRFHDAAPEIGQRETLFFMVSLFRDVLVDDTEDKTYLSLVYNTVNFLNRNVSLADKFQVQVAKTKNGQEFYFEKFVNIDKLDSYYGNGLRYYYAEKQTVNAQIFAHSLLIYRYWLTQNTEQLNKHYEILSGLETNGATVTPFVYGRYLAAQIYYRHANSLGTDSAIQKSYSYYIGIDRETDAASFPRFELYLAEALVLTGSYDEGLLFIEQAKKTSAEKDGYTHWKFFQNFLLLETVALCKKGNPEAAEQFFPQIHPAEFYFLRRVFSNVLHLHIIRQLKRQSTAHDEQLEECIRQTGFTRLRDLF